MPCCTKGAEACKKKVWIEGHTTGSTGAVRNFDTKRLAQGEEWARNHHGEV